jgi:rRNA maturation endonuclease Nob1
MQNRAIARQDMDTWYIKCPVCGTRVELEECPAPGGMAHNVEFCPECGAEIEIIPPEEE